MLIENDPDVLFECDYCKATISPNAVLIIDNGYHFCSLTCHKHKLAKEMADAIRDAHQSTFIPPR